MNRQLSERRWSYSFRLDILLAAVAGAIIFAFLTVTTGGVLIWVVAIAAAVALFALVHYLFWGREFLSDVAPERRTAEAIERRQRDESKPADEIALMVNEQERLDLIQTLEEALAQSPGGEPPAPRPSNKQTVRNVLTKLREFGA